MGQVLPNDHYTYLRNHPQNCNTKQVLNSRSLGVCPALEVPFYQIVYRNITASQIEYVYKFMNNQYINVSLTRKIDEYEAESVPFLIANENVYGYKLKNSEKNKKQVLFKMRIIGEEQGIIDSFAEAKLLSLLQVGPYIGHMADNSDGYLTNKSIEYFGEVAPDFRDVDAQKFQEKAKKTVEKLKEKGFQVDMEKVTQLAFSTFQKNIIIKSNINHKHEKFFAVNPNDQSGSSVSIAKSSFLRNIRKEFDDEAIKIMKSLDAKSNNLTCIENYLFQKNIEKAIEQFEETCSNIENRKEKLIYVDKFCSLLAESVYFSDYEEQVITEALAESCILNSVTVGSIQSFYSKKLEERLNKLKIGSTEFGSEKQLQDFSNTNSVDGNSVRMEQLKINIQGNNKNRVKEIIKEIKEKEGRKLEHEYELNYEYALMLMKSRKSRHALALFELLTREDSVPGKVKAHLFNLMGIIYYNRDQFSSARREFENGLSKLLKVRCYSPDMALIYNNIGCTLYRLQMYNGSLQYFNKSLSLSSSSSDYRMMARSNRAVSFMDKGLLKQARNQFLQIIRMFQPVNNASIICKTFTNLGYLDLLQKDLQQATANLQIANKIQTNCLIPNGFRPSIYLHNNLAILYYKRGDKRKALAHIEQCKDQIQTLKDMEAVMINFNFAMINKELLFHEYTLGHLTECRRLLMRMPEGQRIRYIGKIESEIQRINELRIVEDSQQSSCYNRQSFTSRYSNSTRKHT